ncbi:DUF2516 family protein [Mycobacterium sp. MYCO198283]|uniref:DUF2516 family protein n=1 Tax=Mycobacterium sp. MYCO198283 TaxID=2883505 RepID=UPI001E545449|nr:DUF2516 family protein [Mycobacterium sp. MYCO198283]MCG5432288.1 DUF2516 family protein [Mycobacterium sp. MYCO198283]
MTIVAIVLAVVLFGVLIAACYAFVHAAMQRPDAYTATGKLTKNAWLAISGGAFLVAILAFFTTSIFLGSIAAVAAGVYIVDVRPKLLEIQGKSR